MSYSSLYPFTSLLSFSSHPGARCRPFELIAIIDATRRPPLSTHPSHRLCHVLLPPPSSTFSWLDVIVVVRSARSTCKVLVVVADHDAEDSRDVVALCSLSSSAALSSTYTVPFDVDHDTGSCRFVVVVVFSMTTPLTQVLAFRLQNSTRVMNEGPSSCELSEADVRSMVKFPTIRDPCDRRPLAVVVFSRRVGVGGMNLRARMGVGLERCRSVKASVTQTVACGCRRRSATSKGQNEKPDGRVLKVYAFCGRLWMRPGSHYIPRPTSLAHTCGARVLDAKRCHRRCGLLEMRPRFLLHSKIHLSPPSTPKHTPGSGVFDTSLEKTGHGSVCIVTQAFI
ncbi:hypothetical protein DFP72DRAFT_1170711 [Ephemerocybe angulata]|uniref:Uncharacterized protein n=1 Tax=Ephemerocybe angulata TaxID=980116 RepID=A0A8H6HWI0_9AGAR|nr:hypothetical protein DFP72DRAFT_1170711 [Tulosesus angulatus]